MVKNCGVDPCCIILSEDGNKHLPVFSDAGAQVRRRLSLFPSFSTSQSGSSPCQKSLVCALGVTLGPIAVSHWLVGALNRYQKTHERAGRIFFFIFPPHSLQKPLH